MTDNDISWAGHHQTANGPGDRGSCELRIMHVPVTLPSPPSEPLPAVGRTNVSLLSNVYAAS